VFRVECSNFDRFDRNIIVSKNLNQNLVHGTIVKEGELPKSPRLRQWFARKGRSEWEPVIPVRDFPGNIRLEP